MRAMRFRLAAAGLICLLALSAGVATARVHLSIGLGTSFGHYYPHYHGYGYPYHRCYGGYYRPWWRHSHWPGHYRPHGSSLWIHHSSPIIINSRSHSKAPAENPSPEPQLSQGMRKEQSELLKVLKIGDKENRVGAIRELTSFYFDDKARTALEDVLLSDPDSDVRREVATSLGRTANTKVTATLKTAKAKDPDRGVRQAAYRSIILIEGY